MPLERARRDSHIVEVTGSQINDRSALLSTHPLQQIQASQTRRFRTSAPDDHGAGATVCATAAPPLVRLPWRWGLIRY